MREHGFTLVELLIAMVLAGVAMTAIYSAYYSQQRAYEITQDYTDVQQNIRNAMYFMEKDLRMAGYDPTISGNFGFTDISNQNRVTFTLDVNEDGLVSGTTEYIIYKYHPEQNTLERNSGGSFFDVANYITGVTFTFLNFNGNATASASSIRSVRVEISGDKDGRSRTSSTRVLCRNLNL